MQKPAFENISIEANESIRVLHYTCSAFQGDHTWHFHPQYEISLILKGSGKRFVGDHIGSFYPGDLVLIGPNIPHCWISDDHETENEMLVVQFDPLFLGETFYSIPEARAVKALFTASQQAVLFPNGTFDEAKKWLLNVQDNDGLARIAHLLLLCDTLSVKDGEKLTSDNFSIEKTSKGADRLTTAINYVKENLSNEIKQPDIANKVNMTPQSFSRFFKAQTGRTFVSFVNEMRITEACHLLTTSDQDILDIALSCGYSNVSHFNRQFLENKQQTPSQYRASQRLKMNFLNNKNQKDTD